LDLSPQAREAWQEIYHDLSADRPGMAGALLARAEAHVMRIAGLYSVLDGSGLIDVPHLEAGLALWQHAEHSTRRIFGDTLGDHVADSILRALRTATELTDSEISDLFRRNVSASRLEQAKGLLLALGLVQCITVETTGRPRKTWRLVTK
jgi:hypothetical protein